jgi:hypothetical protein
MASVAEIATGLRFPVAGDANARLARELDTSKPWVDAVTTAMDRAAALI